MIGTSDQSCWLAEACKILLLSWIALLTPSRKLDFQQASLRRYCVPGSQVLTYLYSTSGDGEVQKRGALHCGASTCKATNAPVLELALQEQPATYSRFTITACQELFRWKCRSPGQYRT